jgi:CubicO group peptidase (beta-lactamase class C family)
MVDSVARLPLVADPGTRWTYGLSFDVLGRVIEVVAGRPLDRYLADEIFEPLGMRATAFRAPPELAGWLTALFSAVGGELRAGPSAIEPLYASGARLLLGGQGLLSTAGDYLRFAQMLLNGGELEGRRILSAASVAMMMRDQLPRGVSYSQGYGFGYGGSVQAATVARPVSGAGTFQWGGVAGTTFWIDPRAKLVAVLLTQRIPSSGGLEGSFRRTVNAALMSR